VDENGEIKSRRKSPKRGTVFDLFSELVSLPTMAVHPNFSLEVVLIREEQVWMDDGQGSWRRKHWSIYDRRLLEVVRAIPFATPDDFLALLPTDLPVEFDTQDLATALHQPRFIAQRMAYCLRAMGLFQMKGKRGRALVYGLV
jgi:hypothetical protein